MVNISIYGYCDTLLVIFCMRVFSQNSGTYCMVPSDWDLALTCICGPNFRSNSSENSPDFLFVRLFVWLNKTRTVKPLRRFHSWRDCAHVTVGGIWCVKEVGNHEGQEAGLKYGFDSIRSKWTFGSGSLRCQEFRRSFEKTG